MCALMTTFLAVSHHGIGHMDIMCILVKDPMVRQQGRWLEGSIFTCITPIPSMGSIPVDPIALLLTGFISSQH